MCVFGCQLKMRCRLERFLLFEAFEDRGTMEYEDFNLYPCLGLNKEGVGVPYDMASIPGNYYVVLKRIFCADIAALGMQKCL